MSIKEVVGNIGDNLHEYSPQIKVALGTIGLITAGVLACKATLKLKEKVEPEKKAFEDIKKIRTSQKEDSDEVSQDVKATYTDKDYAKDILRISFEYSKKMFCLYGVPVGLALLSVGLIANGTHVLTSRNLALSAAYTTLSDAYRRYQERVKEAVGEEMEHDIRYGLTTQKEKRKEVDEAGKTVSVTEYVKVASSDPLACSPYAFYFDESCGESTGDLDCDEHLLKGIQAEFNAKLKLGHYRYVTLNDLYREVRRKDVANENDPDYEEKMRQSMVVGWLRHHGNTNDADNRIDLRVQRIFVNQPVVDEETGWVTTKRVPKLLVDPNVEGNIYNKLIDKMRYTA